MTEINKQITAFMLAVLLLAQGAQGAFAQAFDQSKLFDASFLKNKKTFSLNIPYVIQKRAAGQTILSWARSVNKTNSKIKELLPIIADEKYMMSDNVYTKESCAPNYQGKLNCEISFLTAILPEGDLTAEEKHLLLDFITEKLRHQYNAKDPKFKLYYLYSLLAASLAANADAGREMTESLVNTVKDTSSNPVYQVWSARAIAEIVYFTPYQKRFLEKELGQILYSLSNRLKYEDVENHPIGLKVSNQYTAVKSFMYTLSFFAKKKDDGFLKSMVTTGTFVNRSAYLQNPLPGVDSNGDFLSTPSGLRHNIAFNLITALFNMYSIGGEPQKMNEFIIKYAKLNQSKSDFQNYFLFAILGLELANAYNDNQSLEGWQEQYDNFVYAMSKAIWKAYPSTTICVTVQGGAEVCTEWTLVMEGFKLLGIAAKGGGKVFISLLPVKQALRLSVFIAARKTLWRGAGKLIAGSVPIKSRVQIKAILAAGFGLTLKGDKGVNFPPQQKPVILTMPRQEVLKKIMQ